MASNDSLASDSSKQLNDASAYTQKLLGTQPLDWKQQDTDCISESTVVCALPACDVYHKHLRLSCT